MKNILLTGVSKGLGLTTAQELLKQNYNIYGISRVKNNNVIELEKQYPSNFFYHCHDLSEPKDVKNLLMGKFINHHITIHGFVNNAALAYDDIITNINFEQLEKMYKINVFSPLMLTKHVIRNMLLHNIEGSIVHISSISVHTGYKGLAMYASTKGAIEAFSKNTAREWGQRGIRSNCIVAGFMETDMSSSISSDQKNRIYSRTSLKKPTDLLSVANTVEFLISDKSKSITGQNLFVDNGTI